MKAKEERSNTLFRKGSNLRTDIAHSQSLSPRILATIDTAALIHNYHVIESQVPGQKILPMVKANAYGHGMKNTLIALKNQSTLYGFGVATFEEAIEARETLTQGKIPILVFSGALPWNENARQISLHHGLTPVISNLGDFLNFIRDKKTMAIPYELKFNTGMNRLGIEIKNVPDILRLLAQEPRSRHPQAILTHLAESENPASAQMKKQLRKIQEELKPWKKQFPQTVFHLSNSAAIWNFKKLGMKDFSFAVRPGISLYGVMPWKGEKSSPLKPVMTVQARVVHLLNLKKGDRIGYGGTYAVKKGQQTVAILSAGYADGIHRTLSNQGHVYLNGKKEIFLGRISMDLCAVSCSATTRIGDWAEYLGSSIDIWEQAKKADTVPYELLTSLSQRVQRRYL